jgi:hypothetical protein
MTSVSGKRKLVPLLDNARPHTAVSIQQFLAKQGISELNYHPYYPKLFPPDFSYSPQSNPN